MSEYNLRFYNQQSGVDHEGLSDTITQIGTAMDKWWRDLETDQRIERNFGELVALFHSELSEAYLAWVSEANDDHLPEHVGVVVESGDVIIRICDTIHHLANEKDREEFCNEVIAVAGYPNTSFVQKKPYLLRESSRMLKGDFFAYLHVLLSHSLEDHRKNIVTKKGINRWVVPLGTIVGELINANDRNALGIAINEKMQFNMTRKDHKKEHRLSDNGKKY